VIEACQHTNERNSRIARSTESQPAANGNLRRWRRHSSHYGITMEPRCQPRLS
jgi:hypothetical protein